MAKLPRRKPILLTVREVSELLRIHRPKVYDLINSGFIIGFKVGADWRVRREEVEKLVGQIPDEYFEPNQDNQESSK